jgi:hypothetical protein
MLDYQILAISLYYNLRKSKYEENKIQASMRTFEASLLKQVEVNKMHIDESLIFESQHYINIQMQKIKIRAIFKPQIRKSK